MAIPFVIVLALVTGSYLLGAIPNGLLIARAWGIDIRTVGSGNIGATNVFRSVGKFPGILAFVLDFAKGWVPAWAVPVLVSGAVDGFDVPPQLGLLLGVAAIVGHNWPVYLRFKGGKGVATSAGVLVGVAPIAAAVGLGTWVVLTFGSGYVSLGSVGAAVAVPVAGWMLYRSDGPVLPIALTVLGAMVAWRHRGNIQRLAAGTENRFGKRRAPSSPDAG